MSDRRREIEERFGASARAYADSAGHRSGADLDRMLELAGLRGDERVLDVATGAGHTAVAFAARAAFVVATDLADGMMRATRSASPDLPLALADAQALPFADASFDVVTCRIAPHHFLDVNAFAREAARVLAPSGRALVEDSMAPPDPAVATFLHDAEALRDPTHVRSLTREEWIEVFERAGLRVERVEVLDKRLDFEPWLARADASERVRTDLRARFAAAEPPTRAYLRIESQDTSVHAFTDRKIVVVGLREV